MVVAFSGAARKSEATSTPRAQHSSSKAMTSKKRAGTTLSPPASGSGSRLAQAGIEDGGDEAHDELVALVLRARRLEPVARARQAGRGEGGRHGGSRFGGGRPGCPEA